MILFHSYRVYKNSQEHQMKKIFTSSEEFLDIPLSSLNSPQLSPTNSKQILTKIRRTSSSISYPFARRRNDGGRARTAFALYGLPFRNTQIHPSTTTTVSPCSSLAAKAFVH